MGKGKIFFVGVVVCAFAVPMLSGSYRAEAGGNCESKLVGKTYTCNQNEEIDGQSTIDIEFETGGTSQNFDMTFGAADYGCSCDTTGSVESPKYNGSSSAFDCVSTSTGYTLSGKVNGKKISGQGTSDFGEGVIFTCKES